MDRIGRTGLDEKKLRLIQLINLVANSLREITRLTGSTDLINLWQIVRRFSNTLETLVLFYTVVKRSSCRQHLITHRHKDLYASKRRRNDLYSDSCMTTPRFIANNDS